MTEKLVATTLVLLLAGDAWAQGREKPDPKAVYSVPIGASPSRGNQDGPVILVYACEYSGPYCEKIRRTLSELLEAYPENLQVVHKHFIVFPDKSTRPAIAACAAHEQGKFWEMDRLLWKDGYNNNRDYSAKNLEAIAKRAGLNLGKYRAAIGSKGKCARTVKAEQRAMQKVGTSGVPASFINGRFLSGSVATEKFEALIDEELAKVEKRAGKNKARRRSYYDTWVVKKGLKEVAKKKDTLAKRRPDPKATYAIDVGNSPFKGPADARITLVIACQFTGPYCKKIRPTIDELVDRYGKDIRVAYKHFPIHTNKATKPALAACAAHRQGKYWPMESLLWGPMYDDSDFSDARLLAAATAIGLNIKTYEADIAGACALVIKAESEEARQVGTTGTPSTYINGRYISGAMPVDVFDAVIKEELGKAKKRLGRKSAAGYYDAWVVKKGIKKFVPK